MGDYEEDLGQCRVYGHVQNAGTDGALFSAVGERWFRVEHVGEEMPAGDLGIGFERRAVEARSDTLLLRSVDWAQAGPKTTSSTAEDRV